MGITLKSGEFIGQASVLKRLFSLITDLIFMFFVILSPFTGLIQKLMPNITLENYHMIETNKVLMNQISVISVFMWIILIIYFVYMEMNFSQTLGQMIMGLYVIPEAKDKSESKSEKTGRSAKSESKNGNLWQHVTNNLFLIPVFPFIVLWIIDPVNLLLTGKRFSERISKLKTVQKYRTRIKE